MKPEAQKSITAKSALSSTGGFLSSFTHTLQPYTGCAFGVGCGVYCYVPFLPVHRYSSEGNAWGEYVWAKENIADDDVREALTPGIPRISRRQRTLEAAHGAGLQTQVTLSPFLKISEPDAFSDWLARYAQRVIVDTFTSGDGSRGQRTALSRLPEQYAATGLGDWRTEEEARLFYRLLQEKMGPERVGWSDAGFNALRSVGNKRQLPLL